MPAVQKAAQKALAGQRGAIVALDPKTGALIASASAPTYDPANLDDQWARLSADGNAPLLNRPTQGLYVPGSAFKVVTAAGALDYGKVTPTTPFVDTGTYVVFGGKVTNYGGEVFGPNDFTTALTLSINTTFGKVGNLLQRKRLEATMQRFGFYQTPPLPLPAGEVVPSGRYGKKGLLPPDAFMDPLAVAWAAVGQEKLLATPLQMALVAARRGQRRPRHEAVLHAAGRRALRDRGAAGAAAAVEGGDEAGGRGGAQHDDAARRHRRDRARRRRCRASRSPARPARRRRATGRTWPGSSPSRRPTTPRSPSPWSSRTRS